jgi:hypothetical protein
VQQQTTAARVFTGDGAHAGQHLAGPGGEVPQVADGGAHQIEHASGGFGLLHNAPQWGTGP